MGYDLRTQLEEEEGRVPHVYLDHLGFATIGVGHLIDERKGGRLRDSEVDFILANDISEKTGQVMGALPWVADLNEARRAVLIGMAFQLGIRGLLGFRQTLAHIRAGRYDQAARGMLASLWARQTPERAHRMAEQMRSGAWQIKP